MVGCCGRDDMFASSSCCARWTILSISGGRLVSSLSEIIASLLSLFGSASLAKVSVSFVRQLSLAFMPVKGVITSLKHS